MAQQQQNGEPVMRRYAHIHSFVIHFIAMLLILIPFNHVFDFSCTCAFAFFSGRTSMHVSSALVSHAFPCLSLLRTSHGVSTTACMDSSDLRCSLHWGARSDHTLSKNRAHGTYAPLLVDFPLNFPLFARLLRVQRPWPAMSMSSLLRLQTLRPYRMTLLTRHY